MSIALVSVITTSASPQQATAMIRERIQTTSELPITENPEKAPQTPSAAFTVDLVKTTDSAAQEFGFTLFEKAEIGQSFRDSGKAKVITHDPKTLFSLLSVVGRKLGEVNILIKGELPQSPLPTAPKRLF